MMILLNYFALAGIMITASHNPKADNGYKLYWNNGSQIIPPHDTEMASKILMCLQPWKTYSYDSADISSNPLAISCTGELASAYFASVARLSLHSDDLNPHSSIRVAYSGKVCVCYAA